MKNRPSAQAGYSGFQLDHPSLKLPEKGAIPEVGSLHWAEVVIPSPGGPNLGQEFVAIVAPVENLKPDRQEWESWHHSVTVSLAQSGRTCPSEQA